MPSVIPILDKAIIISKEEDYFGKKKTSFWASETDAMAFDIFHKWKGTTPTNPMTEQTLMMLKMRKLTEEAIVYLLKKSGLVIDKYTNADRCFIEWGPKKVPISGYPDLGIMMGKDETIIEIKTFYGGYQETLIRNGSVRQSYLNQLAIYMYHWEVKHGILLLVNQGTGERYEFELYQENENKHEFICPDNGKEFSLEPVFKRFEKIYTENILKDIEPEIDGIYKYDIEKIKWDEISKAVISKARNNKAVIGDWQVKYSDFKDIIIEKQKTSLGYTNKEVARIKELTDGYTVKAVNKVKFNPKDL